MLKKILSILLAILLIGFAPIISAYADDFPEDNNATFEDFEKLIVCQATLQDDFEDDSVIVVMKQAYGGINKVYNENHFGNMFNEIQDRFYIEGVIEENDLVNVEEFHQILQLFLKTPGKTNVLEAIKELEKRDDILSAEPEYINQIDLCAEPNDPRYKSGEQWNLPHISAPAAWNIEKGSRAVKVGVLDTGVLPHDDLTANVTTGYSIPPGWADTDQRTGHGTRVAGIIGAVGHNKLGISGVCWNVTIVPIKYSSFGTGGVSIGQALEYAANNEIHIVNMSLGSYSFNSNHYNAIRNYSGLVVASAGNDNNNNDTKPHYPSDYELPNIISVGASDKDDKRISYGSGNDTGSNYGANNVDLFAPSSDLLTTGVNGNDYHHYTTWGGTSMAAPHVTGVAALIRSANSTLSATQVKHLILENVDVAGAGLKPNSNLAGKCVTGGRLNAYKAVNAAKSKYTVTYDPNGGDGIASSQSFGTGAIPLKPLVFTAPVGKSFEGWATDPNGTMTMIADGGIYTATGNVTLYAIWDTHGNSHETAYEIDNEDYLLNYKLFDIFNSQMDYKGDIDFFKFRAPFVGGGISSEYTMNFSIYTSHCAPIMAELYDKNKNFLARETLLGSNSKLSYVNIGAGQTYYFKLYGLASVGNYSLHIDYGDDITAPYNIGIGNSLEENGMLDFSGDVDFVRFSVLTTGVYDIFTESDIDTIGALYDSNQNLIASNDNYKGASDFKIRQCSLARNQNYYIRVSGNGNAVGEFVLKTAVSTYSITYDANGGSGEPPGITKTHGTAINLGAMPTTPKSYNIEFNANNETNIPSKTRNCTFVGWNTSFDGMGTNYNSGANFTVNADTTLYANWRNPIAGTLPTPTKDGYNFDGWWSAPHGGSKIVYMTEIGTSTTVYAQWKEKTYTVTYHSNDGTNIYGTDAKSHFSQLTLKSDVPPPTNYVLVGWATSPSATVPTYHLSYGVYNGNADIDLYAVWAPKSYHISFNVGEGIGGGPSSITQSHVYGTTIKLLNRQSGITKPGFVLAGWTTTKDSTIVEYLPGATYTVSGYTVFYAVWTVAPTHMLTYRHSDSPGSWVMYEFLMYGDTITTHIPTYPYSSYNSTPVKFVGWALDAYNGIVEYLSGDVFSEIADTVLYAVFTRNNSDIVIFDANGGGPKYNFMSSYADMRIPNYFTPQRDGFIFLGWSEERNATTADYSENDYVSFSGDMTLYAVWWEEPGYSIRYNSSGGSNAPLTQIKTPGIDKTLSGATPTHSDYTFLYWTDGVNNYNPGDTYNTDANLKLTAVWDVPTYTVDFILDVDERMPDGSVSINTVTSYYEWDEGSNYGGILFDLPWDYPIKEGYVCVGWETTQNAEWGEYILGDSRYIDSNLTLFPVWKPLNFTITYDLNAGLNSVTGIPHTIAGEYTAGQHFANAEITHYIPIREGYTFLGWAVTNDAVAASYGSLHWMTDEMWWNGMTSYIWLQDDTTLYAVWELTS